MQFATRYIGSMVADFHCKLLKGGIHTYPAKAKGPQGKLRLMYECNLLALTVEQADSRSSNGRQRTLESEPQVAHERCPVFIGGAELVRQVQKFWLRKKRPRRFRPRERVGNQKGGVK